MFPHRLTIGLVAAVLTALVPAPAYADEAPAYVTTTVKIPTRFHEDLRGEISIPAEHGTAMSGRFPVILQYTPYCSGSDTSLPTESFWAPRRYVYAYVYFPGACGSEGRLSVFGPKVGQAGHDAVEWLAVRTWSTGKVGMVGQSAAGISQLHTAREHPPHLTTIAPNVASYDLYEDSAYPGGIQNTLLLAGYAATITSRFYGTGVTERAGDPDAPQDMLDSGAIHGDDFAAKAFTHPLKDDFWTSRQVDLRDVDVPVFALSNWDDLFARAAPHLFLDTGSRRNRLTIGAGGHELPKPGYDAMGQILTWMDYWLKGVQNGTVEKIANEPVDYYVLGAGRWQTAKTWPPSPRVRSLRTAAGDTVGGADGKLTTGPADRGASQYTYVPGAGSPSGTEAQPINLDQRPVPGTAAAFATDPLPDDLTVTGTPTVALRAATTARDTDWLVRLVDIPPDGNQAAPENRVGDWWLATRGQLRASHRAGHDHLEPVPAGQPVEYEITMLPISYRFKKGHRLALIVTSADAVRGLGTPYPATNTVFHGSSVTLPLG
jgi:putative CocE/NonD family hydrolase